MLREDLCPKTLQGKDFFWGQEKTLDPAEVSPAQATKRTGPAEGSTESCSYCGSRDAPPVPSVPSPREGELPPTDPSLCRQHLGKAVLYHLCLSSAGSHHQHGFGKTVQDLVHNQLRLMLLLKETGQAPCAYCHPQVESISRVFHAGTYHGVLVQHLHRAVCFQ